MFQLDTTSSHTKKICENCFEKISDIHKRRESLKAAVVSLGAEVDLGQTLRAATIEKIKMVSTLFDFIQSINWN